MKRKNGEKQNDNLVLERINEIRNALNLELYDSALALALTLPDICGKVEYPREQSSKKRYTDWFINFAEPFFTANTIILPGNQHADYIWLTAMECWALRCSVLHAGNYDVEGVSLKQVRLHAHLRNGENYSHTVRDSQHADWDVICLCNTLCDAVIKYYDNIDDRSRFAVDAVKLYTW